MKAIQNKIGIALFIVVIFAGHASAQLFWAGAGFDPAAAGSGTWDNANLQWSSTFPTYTGATWDNNIANFNGTGGGTVTVADNIAVSDLNFGANAGGFTISVNPGVGLNFSGAGVTNNSGLTQNFVTTTDATGAHATITFNLIGGTSATAGNLTVFTNNAATVTGGFGGVTQFYGSSTAASASFFNNGVSFVNGAGGGFTEFFDGSTAANSTITNSGSFGAGGGGGFTQFFDNTGLGLAASAGNAMITNGGGIAGGNGGFTQFFGASTASNATIQNNGGGGDGSGGFLQFFNTSTAANARITNNGAAEPNSGAAFTQFFNTSSAGSGNITNNGGANDAAEPGGFTQFNDNSDAGSATITSNGGMSSSAPGGFVQFNSTAHADSATLIANNSAVGAGGSIFFFNDSTGDTSRNEIFGNGKLDISGHNGALTVGSIEGDGNIFLGGNNLTVGRNNRSTTFSGVIQDGGVSGGSGGALTKIGTGTLTLSGANTYTGGTKIDNGVLSVGNPNALGTGNVLIAGGAGDSTLRTAGETPLTFFAGDSAHDFTMLGGNPLTILRMKVGGTVQMVDADFMHVGRDAFLAGELFVHRINNYTPAPGDRVTILDTGDPTGRNGTFQMVLSDFPGLIQPMADYFAEHVDVVFRLGSFTSVPGLTFNQNAVAVALNEAFLDACLPTSTFTILGNRPIATLPHIFDLIAPEEFAAMYEISFSRAVVQSGNLQGRMDQIRENADPNCGPIVEINPPIQDGKNVVSKNVAPPAPGPDNRWGTFAMGSGDYVTVHNKDENADGYKIANGSFLAGVDYRLLHNLAIGVYGGYVGSESNLVGHGRIISDGGTVGGFATFFSHNFYLQAAGGGGWNSYENRRMAFLSGAQSSTNGSELNAMGAVGYDWSMNFNAANHPGSLTVGPIASVQYTNVDINGFRERGSLIPLEFPDQSEDSLRSTIGGKVAICLQTDHGIMLRPEARVAWLHEYNDRAYPIDARFVGCPDIFTVRGPRIGEDAAQVMAGLTVQFNPMVALFAHYEGIFGRDNYDSNGVSGGLALSF